jgi:hypothetical protein
MDRNAFANASMHYNPNATLITAIGDWVHFERRENQRALPKTENISPIFVAVSALRSASRFDSSDHEIQSQATNLCILVEDEVSPLK